MSTNFISRFFTAYATEHNRFSRNIYCASISTIVAYFAHELPHDTNDQKENSNGNQLEQQIYSAFQSLNLITIALFELNAIFAGLRKVCAVEHEPPTHNQNVIGQR